MYEASISLRDLKGQTKNLFTLQDSAAIEYFKVDSNPCQFLGAFVQTDQTTSKCLRR